MRERIAVFFGRELAESLLWVEGKLDTLSLWGYVAHPSQSRSTNKGQFLFLGGRYVRDRSLAHALGEAYRGLLMVGRNPVAFLHLEVPPEEVDVNVHPTKIEVRFRDPQRVYSHLLSTLRQTFLASDLHTRLQAAQEQPAPGAAPIAGRSGMLETNGDFPGTSAGASSTTARTGDFEFSSPSPDRQAVASWFTSGPASSTPAIPDSVGRVEPPEWSRSLPGQFQFAAADAFDEFGAAADTGSATALPGSQVPAAAPPSAPGERGAFAGEQRLDPKLVAGPLKAIQVHDSYLIAETEDGMMVIDQHALHERILYEELRERVAGGKAESQGLLVPEPVHLSADEAAAILEHRELLAELGIEVEPFGGDTVLVRGTPAMLTHLTPDRLIRDLAEHVHTQPIPPSRDALVAELLHMVACKAAVKAGDRLRPEEIEALLERRHLVADSHHCPHGRPTALVFTKAELEKQFGRI